MLEKLLKAYLKKANPDSQLKNADIEKVTRGIGIFQSKLIAFFAVFFMLAVFLNTFFITLFLIGITFTNEVEEAQKFYFILGGLGTASVSYGSFRIMRWGWRKLREPIEQELKLKI